MQILTTIALIIIGVLFFMLIIFSHEFGHFITAKLSGVKVNEFAIGMGPRLFGFKKGETEYTFRLFPIGGYCAMEGEDEDSDEPRAFNNAKVWKRMIIIIAGAVMNILLGFILMFAYTVQSDSYASTTVSQFAPNSYSANCGLQEGDKIVEVNGYSVWNIRDLQFGIATLQCQEVDGKSLEVYKEDCTNSAYDVYADLAVENKLEGEKAQEFYDMLCNGCEKINTAKSKEDAKKHLDDVCTSLYEYFDVRDYKLPTITEKDARKRFIADLKVVRDGETIELDGVQFFTYYATDEDKAADKPSVSFDFYVDKRNKSSLN